MIHRRNSRNWLDRNSGDFTPIGTPSTASEDGVTSIAPSVPWTSIVARPLRQIPRPEFKAGPSLKKDLALGPLLDGQPMVEPAPLSPTGAPDSLGRQIAQEKADGIEEVGTIADERPVDLPGHADDPAQPPGADQLRGRPVMTLEAKLMAARQLRTVLLAHRDHRRHLGSVQGQWLLAEDPPDPRHRRGLDDLSVRLGPGADADDIGPDLVEHLTKIAIAPQVRPTVEGGGDRLRRDVADSDQPDQAGPLVCIGMVGRDASVADERRPQRRAEPGGLPDRDPTNLPESPSQETGHRERSFANEQLGADRLNSP